MSPDKKLEKIKALNDLVQVCKAGEIGFRLAAHEVKNKDYRTFLLKSAMMRNAFADQLENEIRELGGVPKIHAGLESGIHRTWMNLRHLINFGNDDIVLEECRRGEESALKAYQDVFEHACLPEVDSLLKTQFAHIIETRDTLLNLLKGEIDTKPEETMLHL